MSTYNLFNGTKHCMCFFTSHESDPSATELIQSDDDGNEFGGSSSSES